MKDLNNKEANIRPMNRKEKKVYLLLLILIMTGALLLTTKQQEYSIIGTILIIGSILWGLAKAMNQY